MKIQQIIKKALTVALCAIGFSVLCSAPVFAEAGISLSPLNQKIILTPGETYTGSFRISSAATNDENINYKISVEPFYVNEDYEIYYQNNGDYNQIVDWTTVSKNSGTLVPNSGEDIYYTVDVPLNAPAGGQYMAIKTSSVPNDSENASGKGIGISTSYGMAYIVYAEIAGTTIRSGEITDISVPGFLLSGDIDGTSSIKNTGNVHGTATYTLRVLPLFSSEEVYTNEEDPQTRTILPERTFVNTTTWENTPSIGVFNVVYTVEFEGETTTVEKMVIKCPIWLLAIIIFVIVLIIIWIVSRSKSRKKANR